MLIIWIPLLQIMLVHSTPATYTLCVDTCICNKTVVENIEDNSAVVFSSTQSSTVVLDCVMHIANKINISLCGSSGSHTEILCLGTEAGIKFTNVTNLTMSRILFVACGNPANVTIGNDTPRISAIWFYYCENIWLTDIVVRDSTGTAIVFIDNIGYIEINHSSFKNNPYNNNISLSHGGGVHVRFNPDKTKDAYRHQQGSCNIVFHNNTFTHNSGPLDNNTESFLDKQHLLAVNNRSGQGGGLTFHFEDCDDWYTEKLAEVTDCLFIDNSGHHGGGMTLNFTGNTTNNNVIVRSCSFINNEADLGGGLSVTFAHNPRNNSVLLSHLYFQDNRAEGGGGGIEISFLPKHPLTNTLTLQTCSIVGNRAQYGGGTVLHCTKTELPIYKTLIKFVDCSWKENTAQFGAAVEASLDAVNTINSGYVPFPAFKDCQFSSNYRIPDTYQTDIYTRLAWGKGVFFTTALPIKFEGKTSFIGSNTSALFVSSSFVNFGVGSRVEFLNNKGYEGGAVNLIGISELQVMDNSTFLFENNTAFRGGAIIHRSTSKLDFVSSKNCFIRYVGNTKMVSERSITITFQNNTAKSYNDVLSYGNTLFVTTLLPCQRACKDQQGSANDTICIGNVMYMDSYEVSTDGDVFSLQDNNIISAIPGKEVEMNFKLLDGTRKEVHGSYHVQVSNTPNGQSTVKLDPIYSYINNRTIKLFGKPGDKAYVTIVMDDFRDIAVKLEVQMEPCPPGLVTNWNDKKHGIECVCSADTKNKTYFGILRCALNEYRAYLIHGYWIGYDSDKMSESTLQSGYCPRGFCTKNESKGKQLQLPLNSSQPKLNEIICVKHRKGKLCGSCSNNNSVFYHSNNYYCHKNIHCEVGLLLYLISEIIPVTLLFLAVMFFNIKFTSGGLNGFIFFVQFIDTMLIDANGFIATNEAVDNFRSTYQFIYGMFNLNFFTLEKLSFCLWKEATTLDVLAFKYVTIVYCITLVILTVLLKKFACFKKRRPSTESVKGTMIHGFSAFFVMCYSQCAKATLFILNPGRVHSMGPPNNYNITTVVFYQGDYKYLGKDHLKYALPAALFGTAMVLTPPLFLVIYPLCYKVFALLCIEETRCMHITCRVLPLERMKPVFDSFQGCFKDKYRFFAGLYVLYRLVALLTYSVTDSPTKFYSALEVQLIVMLALQATIYPYNRPWHNIIDILLFADLAIINAMTMYNYKRSKERNVDEISINLVSVVQIILVLVPFVYMLCFVTMQLVERIRRRNKKEKSNNELTDTLALVDYRSLKVTLMNR